MVRFRSQNANDIVTEESEPFSKEIRKATQQVHSLAEQTGFIRGFLRGTASHESYLQLLTDLLPVYEEMEHQIARLHAKGESLLLPFYMPELHRSAALKRDIHFIANSIIPEKAEAIRPSAFSMSYVHRIRTVADSEEPIRLAGHLYTRYLGDLSGGQILARIARNAMGLDEGGGLDFYTFRRINSVAESKKEFRAALDTLDGDSLAEKLVTEEAIISFKHNIAIFNSLRGNSLRSVWRNLVSLTKKEAPELSHV